MDNMTEKHWHQLKDGYSKAHPVYSLQPVAANDIYLVSQPGQGRGSKKIQEGNKRLHLQVKNGSN